MVNRSKRRWTRMNKQSKIRLKPIQNHCYEWMVTLCKNAHNSKIIVKVTHANTLEYSRLLIWQLYIQRTAMPKNCAQFQWFVFLCVCVCFITIVFIFNEVFNNVLTIQIEMFILNKLFTNHFWVVFQPRLWSMEHLRRWLGLASNLDGFRWNQIQEYDWTNLNFQIDEHRPMSTEIKRNI